MNFNVENTLAVMIDVQEKLLPHIDNYEELQTNITVLLQGIKALKIDLLVNEQYKKGLGETIPQLKEIVGDCEFYEKTSFSCCGEQSTLDIIKSTHKDYIAIFGIEAHICVLQSGLDFLRLGYKVIVIEDCIGSRKQKDKDAGLKRLYGCGAIPATYESFLFEMIKNSKHEEFKTISGLIK